MHQCQLMMEIKKFIICYFILRAMIFGLILYPRLFMTTQLISSSLGSYGRFLENLERRSQEEWYKPDIWRKWFFL